MSAEKDGGPLLLFAFWSRRNAAPEEGLLELDVEAYVGRDDRAAHLIAGLPATVLPGP
jgi:hypothetical protein